MRIIKNCCSEHNISTARAIQIGTLNYYRENDSKFIVDPQEGFGFHTFRSEDKKIIFQEKDATALSQGMIVGGRIVINPGGKFSGALWSPNVYIFCCSYVEYPSKELADSFGYDSYYEIADPDMFMRKVQEGFTGRVRLRLANIRTVEVMHIHGPVRYQEIREHLHSSECSLSDLMIRNLFTKPKVSPIHSDINFAENQEYRFAWIFLEEETKRILEVEDAPILILNVEAIRQACSY